MAIISINITGVSFALQRLMAKTCTAYGCDDKTLRGLPFCKGCFKTLHRELRHELITAYKVGGLKAIAFADQARDLFIKRKDTVADRERNEKTEISAELRQSRERSYMVWAGGMKEFNGEDKEDWICLPKSLCKKINDSTFEVPYWLAKEKGLI